MKTEPHGPITSGIDQLSEAGHNPEIITTMPDRTDVALFLGSVEVGH